MASRPRAIRTRGGLRHVALKTRDLRTTERFYVGLLGLERAFPHAGMLFLRTPGADDLLNFVETRAAFDPRAGGLDHFGLRVPGARWRQVLDGLRRAHVKIGGRRGRSAVYIRDPNGYTLELYRD
jgi:catechol 2,3-dioxygenase-like lactoylglutathione lyase family enzyme